MIKRMRITIQNAGHVPNVVGELNSPEIVYESVLVTVIWDRA